MFSRWQVAGIAFAFLTAGCLSAGNEAVPPREADATPVSSPLPLFRPFNLSTGLLVFDLDIEGGPIDVTVKLHELPYADDQDDRWFCFTFANHTHPKAMFGCRAGLGKDKQLVSVSNNNDTIGLGPKKDDVFDGIGIGVAGGWTWTLKGDEHYHLVLGTNAAHARFDLYMNATSPVTTTFVPAESDGAAVGFLLSTTAGAFDERIEVWTPVVGAVIVRTTLPLAGGLIHFDTFGTGPWVASIESPSGFTCHSTEYIRPSPFGRLIMEGAAPGDYRFEATLPPHATTGLTPIVLINYFSIPGHHDVVQTPRCW